MEGHELLHAPAIEAAAAEPLRHALHRVADPLLLRRPRGAVEERPDAGLVGGRLAPEPQRDDGRSGGGREGGCEEEGPARHGHGSRLRSIRAPLGGGPGAPRPARGRLTFPGRDASPR